jgi:hypothetical protein
MREARIMGLVKTRRLAAMHKQQRAKFGKGKAVVKVKMDAGKCVSFSRGVK